MKDLLQLNRTPVSPIVLFPLLWLIGALLSQIHLLSVQSAWKWPMVLVVVAVFASFIAGGLIGAGLGCLIRWTPDRLPKLSDRSIRLLLLVCLLIGLAELAHQFVKIGGIPLIHPEGNEIRFNQGGPSVILINLLTVAGLFSFVHPRNLFSREAWFELLVVCISLFGFMLQGGRGSLALMLVVAIAARWLYWGRPHLALLFAGGVAGVTIVSLVFYLRTRNYYFLPFEAELFGSVLPDMPFFLKPLLPVYIAIVTNFHALQGLVGEIPALRPFGGGLYNSVGFDLFIPATTVAEVSGAITPPWVTSTVAGSLWADGGFPVVVAGVGLTGIISMVAFTMARRTGGLGWCLAAGYLLFVTLFGLYTNLWTQQVDWLMVAPLLLAVGIVGDSRARWQSAGSDRFTRMPTMSDGNPEPNSLPGKDRPVSAKSWLLLGISGLVFLMVAGLVVQRLLPLPLAASGSAPLPPTVQSPHWVFSDGDRAADSGRLFWATAEGDGQVAIYSRKPLKSGRGDLVRTVSIDDIRRTTFDVSIWPKFGDNAIFAITEYPEHVQITTFPADANDGRPQRFKVDVEKPEVGLVNDFAVATWTGDVPDLFVLTRGMSDERLRLQIFSGESGFKKTIFSKRLGSFGVGPKSWSFDVGNVTNYEPNEEGSDRSDLLLFRRDPAKKHTDIQVYAGELDFSGISFRREIDLPGDLSEESRFTILSSRGQPALAVVEMGSEDDAQVTLFSLAELVAKR